jgi:hypothetical protein
MFDAAENRLRRAALGLPAEGALLGALNKYYKVIIRIVLHYLWISAKLDDKCVLARAHTCQFTSSILGAWARILLRIPNATLVRVSGRGSWWC